MVFKTRNIILHILSVLFLSIVVILVLIPLFWILSTSLKPSVEIFANPPHWIPKALTFKNYFNVLFNSSIPRAFLNSTIIGFSTALISLIIGGLTGYGFARFKFRGSNFLSVFILASQMLPVTVIMIPMYYMISDIGLIDTHIGIIIAHLVVALPMATWMVKGYVKGIPVSLEEAARIDGCNTFKTLTLVVMPLLKPALCSTGVYALICSWNEYALANVISRTDASKTLPLGLSEFSTFFKVNWGDTMAAAMIITIPVVIVFMLVQKNFVAGLVSGSVKE